MWVAPQDFIVDEEEEEGAGQGGGRPLSRPAAEEGPSQKQKQLPAVKQRRQVVLSDSEED
jgi:hypothetical protein